MTVPGWPRAVLLVVGLGFTGFGLAYALLPLPMARLTEIPLPTSTARIDFAAQYGGIQLGLGLFLLACVRWPGWLTLGLWAATLSLCAIAFVRLLSAAAVGGRAAPVIWAGLGIELGAAIACGLALRRLGRHQSRVEFPITPSMIAAASPRRQEPLQTS